jgi:hypothetical protein
VDNCFGGRLFLRCMGDLANFLTDDFFISYPSFSSRLLHANRLGWKGHSEYFCTVNFSSRRVPFQYLKILSEQSGLRFLNTQKPYRFHFLSFNVETLGDSTRCGCRVCTASCCTATSVPRSTAFWQRHHQSRFPRLSSCQIGGYRVFRVHDTDAFCLPFSVAQEASPKMPPDRRKRAAEVCRNCHRRKIKCDLHYAGSPCTKCSENGGTCETRTRKAYS